MRVRFWPMCGRLSLRYHRRRYGSLLWWTKPAPVDHHAQVDGRETPAELLTSYDGCLLAGGCMTSQIAKLPHRPINCTTSEAGTVGHTKANLHRLDLIDRRTMAAGQESIDTVAGWCERQRMGPLFRCHTSDDLHGCGVE